MGITLSLGKHISIGGGGGTLKPNGAPSNLILTVLSHTSIKLDWTIGSTNQDGHVIEYSADGLIWVRVDTVLGTTATYTELGLTEATKYYYRVCAYKGSKLSAYSNIASDVTWATAIMAGNTVGWFEKSSANVLKDGSNLVKIWWDKIHGSNDLGVEIATGNTVLRHVYKITATQTNHFFTGCVVGDIWVATSTTALDANNKVQEYLGNHLSQPIDTNKPLWSVGGVLFDGVDNFMESPTFTYIQPEFVYLVLRQKTWTAFDYIIDGYTTDTMVLYQKMATPNIYAYAGTSSGAETHLTLDTIGIVRILFNGASSKLIVNENTPVTGNFGAANASGITMGRKGASTAYSNIEVSEAIFRNVADAAEDETSIYAYLKAKYL